jgi:hypothetical protein
MKLWRLALIAVPAAITIGALGSPPAAHAAATSAAVTRRCSKTSVADLQLEREDNGRISVDFGVDMARHTPNVAWRVRETQNGTPFVNGIARTLADGSFSISSSLAPKPLYRVVAAATNIATGETCTISATL